MFWLFQIKIVVTFVARLELIQATA